MSLVNYQKIKKEPIDLPKVIEPVRRRRRIREVSNLVKAPYGYYYRDYNKLKIYEDGLKWDQYGKNFYKKVEAKWIGNLRKY